MLNKKNLDNTIARHNGTGDLKIISRSDRSFVSLWEEFYWKNKIPIYYSLEWLDFCKAILQKNFIKDLCFLIVKDNQPISIVPLIMEKGPYGIQFSIKNGYLLRVPVVARELSHRLKKKIEKMAFLHIEELAHAEGVSLHRALIDPLFIIDQKFYSNYLLEFDYLDSSILTNVINLQMSENILWGNLRKSYRPLIRGEMKKYEILILDSENITKELFSEFEKLYLLASGRHIYDNSEWDILYKMIQQDLGMLAFAKLNNEIIGGCYFNHDNGKTCYSLSANHPKYEKIYFIGHLLIWKCIKYYLGRKFRWLELGWQFYENQLLEKPTNKEISISHFKRGFGGFSFPLYRGIRFFNDETKNKYIKENLNI